MRRWRSFKSCSLCIAGAQGATALWAEGCGLPLRAMLIKSALRDCLPAIIVILSRRRRISVPDEYEAIGIHTGVWYLKHTSRRLVFSSTPLTYYSYRDPSLRSVFWSYVKSFFEEIYCFFLKKCNLNTPPGKLIFSNIFRRSIFLFQRYHYFVIGIQLMFIQ